MNILVPKYTGILFRNYVFDIYNSNNNKKKKKFITSFWADIRFTRYLLLFLTLKLKFLK